MLQDYFDRWGIEVNHRDEKEILGVGEAQVWNEKSVSKVPALLVAMYSWLLLAGLKCYGPNEPQDYEPLPKWRRGAKRPSCLDLVTLLRKQLAENPMTFATGTTPPTYRPWSEPPPPDKIQANLPAARFQNVQTPGTVNCPTSIRLRFAWRWSRAV